MFYFSLKVQSISSAYWTSEITEGFFTEDPNAVLIEYAKTCNDQVKEQNLCSYFMYFLFSFL